MRLNHTNFINTPITNILNDAILASAGIGDGIETFSLQDYVMQSIFLKMTGFQEQKMKCIIWDLATIDYEYRYKRYSQKKLGECSHYSEKNDIYKDLIACTKKIDSSFSFTINKPRMLEVICRYLQIIFRNTNLALWVKNDYNRFSGILLDSLGNSLDNNTCLFDNQQDDKLEGTNHMRKVYNYLYRHRNRCAHNTQSYQQDLPTLQTLNSIGYQYENYFVRFATLILIDKIFIKLYRSFLRTLENSPLSI